MSLNKSWKEWGCSSVGGSPGSAGESNKVGVLVHTCGPCPWEMETRGSSGSALATFGAWRKLSHAMAFKVSTLWFQTEAFMYTVAVNWIVYRVYAYLRYKDHEGFFCTPLLLEYQSVEGATFCMTRSPEENATHRNQPDFLVQLLQAISVTLFPSRGRRPLGSYASFNH